MSKSNSGNLLFSPFSVQVVLALAQEGARGATRDELLQGLSLPNDTQTVIKSILPKLTVNRGDSKLLTANKIYVQNGFEITGEYKSIATGPYRSGAESVDFSQNVQAANTINKWVESQTNDKIKDLLKSDSLDSTTKLVLVNALYFNAKFVEPFDTYATRKQKFQKNDKESVNVDMMSQTSSFNYYESLELNAKFLEMTYKDSNVTMTIVLPNEVNGLAALEDKLDQVLVRPNYTWEYVAVSLPKFSIETSDIQFVPILQKVSREVSLSISVLIFWFFSLESTRRSLAKRISVASPENLNCRSAK